MTALSFRAKILLAMMALVIAVTITMLLITDNQVRTSYERHFQRTFEFQLDFFLQQREARLNPIRQRLADVAASPRLIAAMENADQAGTDPQDIDDLYQNGLDQLTSAVSTFPAGRTDFQAGLFFFFLDSSGKVLFPRGTVKLPFTLPDSQWIASQATGIGPSVLGVGRQQIGYLKPQSNADNRALEMVCTPVIDPVSGQKLGVLAVGFPLPETKRTGAKASTAKDSLLSGLWLGSHLYSSSIPAEFNSRLSDDINGKLKPNASAQHFVALLGKIPHQVYCQTLETGAGFPQAYQICLYSLADAQAEKQSFRERILLSGVVALLGALAFGLLISRSLTVPLQELVSGATEIERGHYEIKVPVRSRDELGHLATAFNDMAAQVGASHVAQERRIAERTEELAIRKRAEEALREAQRIAHLGNWQWDFTANRMTWSEEIYSIFALTPQQFAGTNDAFLERVHPEDREQVRQTMREALATAKPYSLDHRIVRPGGEVRAVQVRGKVVRQTGNGPQIIGTLQDITEQKKIEAEFLRAQRLDGIGAIAGGMAHDLNNALSPILLGIQLIRRELKQPEMQRMLTVMEHNTHRGAEMVRQVLSFARGHEGEREELNVGRLIREMENIVRQTLPKSITVETMVPSDLWPVLGNATQLHQVLLNLCVNARDAMPAGGVLTLAADNVELTAEDTKQIPGSTAGSYVMLMVSDTGTGIAPEILPKIFDAFFTTKGPEKGTGLGLSTISRIVRSHAGFIGVKSELGTGSTFEIYLPRAGTKAHGLAEPAAAASEFASGRGELILFIDDDRSAREMVAPALADQGYRVLSAANGAEALALMERHSSEVRLVLTDFAMPVLDGVELLDALNQRWPGLPVVLMSGTFSNGQQSLPASVTAFLIKPFRLEQLLSVVAGALRNPAAKAMPTKD